MTLIFDVLKKIVFYSAKYHYYIYKYNVSTRKINT